MANSSSNFKHDKSLGQNFLNDNELLAKIVEDSGINSADTVVEVGAGRGTLTRAIASVANKVISYELDTRLKEGLDRDFINYDNVEFVFADALKDDVNSRINESFKVVANIPYYITSPLIMKFVEEKIATSITVTVQKEVAERLASMPNTSDYGVITVALLLRGDVHITRIIPREKFYPIPKVHSAVVRIDLYEKYKGVDVERVMKVVRNAFAMRRKTLLNNIISKYPLTRAQAENILIELGYPITVRGEALSPDDFIKLTKLLSENK